MLALEPVILDETDDGGLIRHRMIDEIVLCPRRNHKERLTRTIAAATVGRLAEQARKRLLERGEGTRKRLADPGAFKRIDVFVERWVAASASKKSCVSY
jgi:hypothetical protein